MPMVPMQWFAGVSRPGYGLNERHGGCDYVCPLQNSCQQTNLKLVHFHSTASCLRHKFRLSISSPSI